MRLYYWMDHDDEYDKVEESESNILGLEPKASATVQAIRDVYHFQVLAEDKTGQVKYDAEKLSACMIEKFQASSCYEKKSEEERQAIIKYLKDNPEAVPYRPNTFIDI